MFHADRQGRFHFRCVKPELIVDFSKGKDGVFAAKYDFVLMKANKQVA